MYNRRAWFPWAASLSILVLLTGVAGALPRSQGAGRHGATPARTLGRTGPESRREAAGPTTLEPVIGPTSWYDPLNDASGLSWLEQTQLLTDRVHLSLAEVLGENVGSITALSEGPGGVLYMGTTESRLWSYDPATNTTVDLGMPVPDECNN
jgi:hypothetical protein